MLHCVLIRVLLVLPLAAIVGALTLVPPRTSDAAFHFSVIDEVMTSYDGDPTVQFVEIRMLLSGQNVVANTVLGAFDDSGSYLGDVLVVPGNVSNSGSDVRWIMGTSQFQTESGIAPDFTMPADLPTGGGMVCWGLPADHTNPALYVDCLAYGTYSGPSNVHVGTPTSLDAVGHSLQRTQDTANNEADFECGDPADPTNNAGASASLVATVSCTPPTPADKDGDGCTDAQESGPDPTLGGQRDSNYFWDFYDVYTGLPPARDRAVSIGDIGAIVARFGATREPVPTKENALAEALTPPPLAPAYHAAFDRGGPIPGQNLWNLLPPDGSVTIVDIGSVVAQFGHSCG